MEKKEWASKIETFFEWWYFLKKKKKKILYPKKMFIWLNKIVLLTRFGWFKITLWLDELYFCSSSLTRLFEWTKVFGWTALLVLQNILLILQKNFVEFSKQTFFLDQKNYLTSSNICLVGSINIFVRINHTFITKKLCWVN